MSVMICITNSMDGFGCKIRGEHLSNCNGDRCKGCLPRPAETGVLCRSCFEKFEAALTKAVDLITHLRSIEKGPASLVPTRSAPASRVILPGSWLEADNLWSLLQMVAVAHADSMRDDRPTWVTRSGQIPMTATLHDVAMSVRDLVAWLRVSPQNVVARTTGAVAAVQFFRGVQRALAMFPMSERPARVPYLRCRECHLFAVEDKPPLWFLEPRVLQCSECGALSDPQMKEWDLHLYRVELEMEMAARAAENGDAA